MSPVSEIFSSLGWLDLVFPLFWLLIVKLKLPSPSRPESAVPWGFLRQLPQAFTLVNSMIELFLMSLKTALPARLADSDWFLHQPLVLLGLWSVPKEDTGFLSLRLSLALPSEFLVSSWRAPRFRLWCSCRRLSKLCPDLPFLRLNMCLQLNLFIFLQCFCLLSLCLWERMSQFYLSPHRTVVLTW